MSLVFAKAIEDGDLTLVESLLANDSIDVNARLPRPNNPPPLVHAVRCAWSSGRVDIVKLLLSTGADVDGVDDNGQTASFAAALARSVTALAVLLSHRPNLEIADEAKRRPLQISLNRKSDGISLMLINAGASLDGVQSLSSFAARSTAAIEALLNRGVAMNQLRDVMDGTPLHAIATRPAADAHVDDVVKMLINVCDLDLEARTLEGETCTLVTAKTSNDIALRSFIRAGADVSAVNVAGQTPLHVVRDYKCSVLLLAAGADLNARDREGRTAFQLALRWNWSSILPAFLAAGADPSIVDVLDKRVLRSLDVDRVETARRDIARARLDLVRQRAIQVCIGLQSLGLDALQMCEILQHSCGSVAHLIAFHQWWTIATTAKHFHRH